MNAFGTRLLERQPEQAAHIVQPMRKRIRPYIAIATVVCGLICAPAALAADGDEAETPPIEATQPAPPARPAIQDLRFNENWAILRGHEREGLDRIKFIPLNEDEDIHLSFGGQYRIRVEHWSNFGFNNDNDDTFVLNRFRLHGDLHVGDHFRAFLELKSSLSTERDLPGGQRTLDVDTFDIQNAFIDLRFPVDDANITIRPGRQELLFGRQRLVSPLDWSNTRRTFDGVSAIIDLPDWRLHAFWTKPVRVRKYDVNKSESGADFFGLYTQTKIQELGLDLYWLGLDRKDVNIAGDIGSEHRHTFGARLHGMIGESGLDFDVESAVQVGRHASRDVLAWMFSSEVGYRFAGAPWRPRISAGFDYASGDNDLDDNNARTFNQLFPLGHAYFGAIDTVGRQNILAANIGLAFHPHETLTVRLDGHAFWRAERNDALYNAGSGVVRASVPGASREVGQEIDLRVIFNPKRGWTMLFGYSRFFAGDFLSDTGPSEDIDFVYSSLQFTF